MKKLILLVCQLTIILLAHFLVWGDTILLLGIAGIVAQYIFSLKITGWISAIAYPITWWIAGLFDIPMGGNQYVYWYLSYIAITALVFAVEIVAKKNRANGSAQ